MQKNDLNSQQSDDVRTKNSSPNQLNRRWFYVLAGSGVILLTLIIFFVVRNWRESVNELVEVPVFTDEEKTISVSEETEKSKIIDAFLVMKQDLSETATFTQLMKVAEKYFTQNFIDEIGAMTVAEMTDEKKMSFFVEKMQQTQPSFFVEVNDDIEVREVPEGVELTVKADIFTYTTILVKEKDSWRYSGRENITKILDENGEELRVVTEETAEYETTIENGEEIRKMKPGQAILDVKIATASAKEK